jgi:hypothetical protein
MTGRRDLRLGCILFDHIESLFELVSDLIGAAGVVMLAVHQSIGEELAFSLIYINHNYLSIIKPTNTHYTQKHIPQSQ